MRSIWRSRSLYSLENSFAWKLDVTVLRSIKAMNPRQQDWINFVLILIALAIIDWLTLATCTHFFNPSVCKVILF